MLSPTVNVVELVFAVSVRFEGKLYEETYGLT
jgi:hypothetical protein